MKTFNSCLRRIRSSLAQSWPARGAARGQNPGRVRPSAVRWLVLCLLLPGAAKVHSGWLDPRFDLPGANGLIQSLVEFRGALYVVGHFDRIGGVDAPGVARWDGRR